MKGNTLNVMFFILKNKLLKNGEAPVVLRDLEEQVVEER